GQVVFYAPRFGGNVVNVLSVPAPTFLNMVVGDGDVVTIGRNAPNLGGSLAGILGPISVAAAADAHVTFTVDNSGDLSTGSGRLTPGGRRGQYCSGHHLGGFAPAAIYWRLGGHSTLALRGGAADETFAMQSTAFGIPISVDGGGGSNSLDYSA